MARVRSVLRRSQHQPNAATEDSDSIIRFEDLEINQLKKRCTISDEEISLTRKEFDILVLLLSNRGSILSREQIMKRVWSDEVVVLDRTIDVNITRMRKSLANMVITL